MELDQVEELLNGLGDIPEQIANKLFRLGITGVKEDSASCPIANYFNSLGYNCCAGITMLCFYEEANGEWPVRQMPLPSVVSNFVQLFDSGSFPELEEK
jgi:hypothetical protein